MKRQEYMLLAESFRVARSAAPYAVHYDGPQREAYARGVDAAARVMARKLYELHPAFDRKLFLENAGVVLSIKSSIGA